MSSRSVYNPVVCLDCANGVGAVVMSQLIKHLHTVDIKFDIYNDGSQGKLNHMVFPQIIFYDIKAPLTSTWPHLRCDVGLEKGNI